MASMKLLQSSDVIHSPSEINALEDQNCAKKLKNIQPTSKKGLEVTEVSNGLKVQTDKPHLVSLGGGRLSTAVTLLPLPEGRTTIGTSKASTSQDIVIQGTGIEDEHCIIENISGFVTLYPIAPMVSVDGVTVVKPTRLTQGSMICLGRSNYFRFNHPQEAQFMKSLLPNTRISVAPINFSSDLCENNSGLQSSAVVSGIVDSTPKSLSSFSTTASKRDQPIHFYRDELESEDFVEKVSKFEFMSHSRQKPVTSDPSRWFVRDGLRSRLSSSSTSSSSSSLSSLVSPTHPSSKLSKGPINATSPPSSLQITTISSANNCQGKPMLPKKTVSSPSQKNMEPSSSSVSSPVSKFIPFSKIDANISPKVFVPMKTHSASEKSRVFIPGLNESTNTVIIGQSGNKNVENLQLSEQQLEEQRQKVMKERIQEQELEQQEQQRLEEILNMCAEYERQAMKEKKAKAEKKMVQGQTKDIDNRQQENQEPYGHSPKLSPNHSLHMNRIKTNGSLPRDRFNNKVSSVDESLNAYNCKGIKSTSSEDELNRIFTFESHTPVQLKNSQHQFHTGQTSPNSYSTYPQSPRTRIKTVVSREKVDEVYENRLAISDYQLNVNPDETKYKSISLKSIPKETKISSHQFSSGNSDVLRNIPEKENLNKHPSNEVFICNSNSLSNLNSHPMNMSAEELQEMEIQKRQKTVIAKQIADLKRQVMNLDSQEEEIIHELETEKALLEGEHSELLEKQCNDQRKLALLKQKESDFLQRAEISRREENAAIENAHLKLEEEEEKLKQLDCNLDIQPEGSPERDILLRKIRHQQEIVDLEKKNFEDLEFQQLENEAHREEEREQILAEQIALENCCKIRADEIIEIEQQKEDMKLQIKQEAEHIQLERKKLLSLIQEGNITRELEIRKVENDAYYSEYQQLPGKNNLHVIENKMKELNEFIDEHNSDNSTRSSSDEDNKFTEISSSNENANNNKNSEKKSSDDLILKVTSTSPIIAKDEAVGEKASATLMKIERNRQIILEKQGGFVIEKERKRVQELKKKAADEVRSQWEERKQREINCNSFNSIESEASSVTSSDVLPESLSSEEYPDKITDPDVCPSSPDDEKDLFLKVKQRESEAQLALEESRPLLQPTDDNTVKFRGKQLKQQRPLTRYLPIRRDDFNLKQHIESAGHQIELCTHIQLTSSTCRGYLYKLGSKFRTWNKRWFVFDRHRHMLLYYADKSELRPRGGICFQYIMEVYVDHLHAGKSPNPKLTFCVKTIDRTYYLAAPSAEAMRIWVDVIFTGAEGYQEFQQD